MAPRGRGAGAAQHQDSSAIADILNPVTGIRDLQRRAGLIPVDHAKANRDAIRQQSRANKQRRVMGEPATPDYLRPPAGSPAMQRRGSTFGPASGPQTGPTRMVEVSRRDYVRENALEAAAAQPRRRSQRYDDGRQWLCKDEYGLVPQYLQSLKLSMAEQQAADEAAAEAAAMPSGMRVLEEGEREEMLAALSRSKHDIESQLRGMPFVVETPSQIHHKKGLEERLAEVEQALRIFSQRRVLVRSDDADDANCA